jgi:phage I-like protein
MNNYKLAVLSQETGTTAPEWVCILPMGKMTFSAGLALGDADHMNVTAASLAQVIAAWRTQGRDLPIDYEHETIFLKSGKAPAAGWIKELAARADGLWARIEWTAAAKAHIEAGEYRYYSPFVKVDPKTLEPKSLINLSLTNVPAADNMQPLAARMAMRTFTAEERRQAAAEGEAMPDGSFPIKDRNDLENAIHDYGRAADKEAAQKHIIARARALGLMDLLPADWPGSTKNKNEGGKAMKMKLQQLLGGALAAKAQVTDDEIYEALAARLKQAEALPEIAVALGLPKEADAAKITGTILALKQGSEQLTAMRTELDALKTENAQGKARKAVDEALAARKITPAQTEWAKQYAARDPEGFTAFVAAAVPILPQQEFKIPANDKEPGGSLDDGELAVCRQMGIDPKNYLASKQAMTTQ